jgi:hypothetical protein
MGKRLESARLESSLGARVVKAEVVNEDKEGHGDDRRGQHEGRRGQDDGRRGQDEGRRGQDDGKNEPTMKTENEATVVNEGLDTSSREGE